MVVQYCYSIATVIFKKMLVDVLGDINFSVVMILSCERHSDYSYTESQSGSSSSFFLLLLKMFEIVGWNVQP